MVPEGLSKQPVDIISNKIASMGFNCVRFIWPLFLATNDSLDKLSSVRQSFQRLGLSESIAGIKVNNPSFRDQPVLQALQVVVKSLADNSIMVILDNHISNPSSKLLFGDKWIKGLTHMATVFNDTSNVNYVIAMSLRNELRGSDWYKYMQRGAEEVHSVNPNLLLILSVLNYDKDLSFLDKQPFQRKLMIEMHFSDGLSSENGTANKVCGSVVKLMRRRDSLHEKGYPVFLSKFRVYQRDTIVNDNRYLNCIMASAVELDLDSAFWTLTAEGVMSQGEAHGVLNWDRCTSPKPSFTALQTPLHGPNEHVLVSHPENGLCIVRKVVVQQLSFGSCASSEWAYTSQKNLAIRGTYFCIQAVGLGKPAILTILCTDSDTKWEAISDSKMYLSSNLPDGTTVCLDVDSSNNIITNKCSCLSVNHTCDPGSQWFEILAAETRTSFIEDQNEGKSCEVYFVL